MKPRIPLILAFLIFSLGLIFVLIWTGSVYFIVEQQSQISIAEPMSFWKLWLQQLIPVLLLLSAASLAVYYLLNRWLIKPLQRLADTISTLASSDYDKRHGMIEIVTIGLDKVHRDLRAVKRIIKQDSLTGLNNQAIFDERLGQAVSDGKRSGRKYALVLVQIENLELISQQHDQDLVEVFLKKFAQRLTDTLRDSDNVSHFDKGLFALLLEIKDQDQVVSLVEKIFSNLGKRYQILGHRDNVSIVIGASLYPDHATTAEQLHQYASTALYRTQSKVCPIVFFEDDNKTDISTFTLIQSLRSAIENDQFKLVFQPVVDLQAHRTVYLEALLRWKDPRMHDVPIERTIQLAEQNQLIKPLTNWIVLTVCQLIDELQIDDLVIGVNLSMIDLHDHALPGRIDAAMKKYRIKPGKLLVEITEGQIMQKPDEVAEILSHLGMMGLSLSIDDFGTGQASLTYLKKLPVEKLKIDQSFIRDMDESPDDRLIVKATIQLAHTLDLKVIAEGVETVEILDLLEEMDCDYIQGYYISRPLEADKIRGWYQQFGKP